MNDLAKMKSMGNLSKVMKAASWLGPAGDLLGAGLDGYQAHQEWGKGDLHGAIGHGASAAGGAAAGVAGLAIMAGASGPAAPIVLVGGTVVALGGMAYNARYGMDAEQEMITNLGLFEGSEYDQMPDWKKL